MILGLTARSDASMRRSYAPVVRRYLFLSGWVLCASAVLVVRFDHLIRLSGWFPAWFIWLIDNPSTHPWMGKFPPSMSAGLLLLLIGCGFLIAGSTPVPRPQQRNTSIDGERVTWRELWCPGLAAIVSLSVFFIAERQGILARNYMIGVLVLLIFVPFLYLRRNDIRFGVFLSLRLSIREIIGLIVGCFSLVFLYAHGLNSWKYSFIGDEFMFYWDAQKLAKAGIGTIQWLEASGSWNFFPMALDGYQALFLRIFGDSNFSWRFSMSVMVAACLPALYLSLRCMCAKISSTPGVCASFGCAVFFLSEFVIIWARIGKPHAGFLPPVIIVPLFYFAARARQSNLYFFLTGAVCGLGFLMTSLGVFVSIGMVGVWLGIDLLVACRLSRREAGIVLSQSLLVLLGFLVTAAPFLVQVDHFLHIFQSAVDSVEAERNLDLRWAKTFQSFFVFLYYRANGHFLAGNVIGPLIAVFIAAGLGMGRLTWWRIWTNSLVALFVISFLVGGMSQYPYPPVTRMQLIMYPFALFATLGFCGLTTKWRPTLVAGVATLVVTLSAFYNVQKISKYNPYWRAVPTQMVEMKRIQNADLQTVHLYVYGIVGEGYLLESMTDSRGMGEKVQYFFETPEGLADLEVALKRHGGDSLILWSDTVKDVDALKRYSGQYGAEITAINAYRRVRPDDREMGRLGKGMFSFFSFVEREPQG